MDARALAAAFWLSIPFAANAQRIVGTIHETASGIPVSGAVATIIDSAGRPANRTISDEGGHFGILWPDHALRLRVVRIGYRPATLPLPKGAARDTTIDVTMERLPVTLEAVHVSTKNLCAASPEQGAALDLWDQVKAALLNSIVARTAMPAMLSNLTYQRQRNPRTNRVIVQHSRISQGTSPRPFVAGRSAAELAAKGYVSGTGAEQTFYAPDADVLFDDSFTDAHCFGVRSGGDARKGLVALTFEPRKKGSAQIDVRGDLWIDPTSAVLVELDYKYTGVTDEQNGMGGTVHFQSLRNGIVFIDDWSLTLIAVEQTIGRLYRVTAIGESGGTVLAAVWPDGTHWAAHLATIRGQVVEKGSPKPVPHVLVAIDGVDTTVTDSVGRFQFDHLPAGLYSLHAIDTTYEEFHQRRVLAGEASVGRDTVNVNFEVPPAAALLADVCRDQKPERESTTILGRIGDGSQQVPGDVRIESSWFGGQAILAGSFAAYSDRKQSTNVDDDGRFHVCGVGIGRLIRLKAFIGRLPIADTSVIAYDSVARTLAWTLPPASFAQVQGDASALTGRVVHQGDSTAIPDADVWVLSGDVHARTDSAGQYRLYGLHPGRQIVQVRRIGFTERRDTVTLRAGQEVVRDFSLEGNIAFLDTVRSTSGMVAYHKPMLQQFEERRHTGVGRYIPEEVLRKNDNLSVGQVMFGRTPGIELVAYKGWEFAKSLRAQGGPYAIARDTHSPSGCWVSVYYDGAPLTPAPQAQTLPI